MPAGSRTAFLIEAVVTVRGYVYILAMQEKRGDHEYAMPE